MEKDLEFVTQYKYLGIILDSTVTFKNQIQNTIKIVAHKISLLHKIRNFITENAAIQIYKTMFIPYLDYGDIITYNLSNKQTSGTSRQSFENLLQAKNIYPQSNITQIS